jgi:hypothetical protein
MVLQAGYFVSDQTELFAHEIRHFTEDRRDGQQVVTQFGARRVDIGPCHDLVGQGVPVQLDAMHHQAAVTTGNRVNRHQGRVREALVQILHDDA